jgi:hypothetical protein
MSLMWQTFDQSPKYLYQTREAASKTSLFPLPIDLGINPEIRDPGQRKPNVYRPFEGQRYKSVNVSHFLFGNFW